MNLRLLLAQANATVAPSTTTTTSATAGTTSMGTANGGVTTNQLFWETSVGVFVIVLLLLILIAVLGGAVAIGIRARAGSAQTDPIITFIGRLFGDFTNVLAWLVIFLAFIGIFLLCNSVISADHSADTVKYVFGAVLPLLGTWVGAVLAHYFQKENLAAATQSITDLASKVAGTEKLRSTPVKAVMIRPDSIDTLPEGLLGKADNDIKLSELIMHLNEKNRDRVPLFKDNQKTGPAQRVVHKSIIQTFFTKKALPVDAAAKADITPDKMAGLTLADLMNDKELGPVVLGSFALVSANATLADAKNAMDTASAALGSLGNCYDVFVTDGGNADQPVIGWITNDVINENAKV